VFDLNIEREERLQSRRLSFLPKQTTDSRDYLRDEVKKVIRFAPPVEAPVRLEVEMPNDGLYERKEYTIQHHLLRPEWGIRLPAITFTPKPKDERVNQKPFYLYLAEEGVREAAREGGPIEALLRASHQVVALDLRGMGETAPGAPAGPNYFGADSREAFLAFHLDRPLLTQRVVDLLAVTELVNYHGRPDFSLIATGSTGPIALHAAALDHRIKSVVIERSVISWSAVVRSKLCYNQLSNVVPGALEYYDLPDLAALIAPRPLTIRAPVDPLGKPVSQAELEAAYSKCRAAYNRLNADKNLILEAAK
jgi:hypothetical protein